MGARHVSGLFAAGRLKTRGNRGGPFKSVPESQRLLGVMEGSGWPQAEPGVSRFLNEGFAVSSALLIHLKYNKEAFRTFWKRLQKMSQKQNSVTAWWAEGNEPADFTVRECG